MPETNNTTNILPDGKSPKHSWLKKLATIALAGSLLFSKDLDAANTKNALPINDDKSRIELAIALQSWQDAFQLWDDNNRLRSKEEMTIDFIESNFYINWKSARDLNAIVKKENNHLYYVEYEYPFLEWPRKIKITLNTKYENNSISMEFDGLQIFYNGQWKEIKKQINELEIDNNTHNVYDYITVWNWKRENFSIVYNEYSTRKTIEDLIKDKEINPNVKNFERIEEFENTQLVWLNKAFLWKEVFKDWDSYYKTLFYSTNWKKIDITNIYFTKDWKFDAKTTNENKKKLVILWIEIEYEIREKNGRIEYIISEKSKQELEAQVRHDRNVLIKTIKNTPVADFEVFSALNKIEQGNSFEPSSKIIWLNAILWTYPTKLNNDEDKNLEQINFKVEWENIIIVDETWRKLDNFYFNYETRNWKDSQSYRINSNNDALIMTKISAKKENPKEVLPHYTWDNHAINLLRSGILTNNEGGYLNHYTIEWILVAKMPYDKQEDWSYKFNEEKYHTNVKAIDLFKYPWFEKKTQKIAELAQNLWLTNTDIRSIFEQSLINDWFDFNQNAVKIKNPMTWKSVYYTLDKKNRIEVAQKIYDIAEKHIDFMLNRLELAQIVNNSKVLWKNGKDYKDFELFIWWEAWIWKQILSKEQVKAFIDWESDEITTRISRWSWNYTDIIFTASGKKLTYRLKSGEWKWSVYLNPQRYYIKVDKNWNIILDPKEERE